jgi:hypothetical protein
MVNKRRENMDIQTNKILQYPEASASDKNFKVVMFFAGEGYNGDYDETDSEDEPLLRIDIYRRCAEDKRRWKDEPEYSSCTGISARVTRADAIEYCNSVLKQLESTPKRNNGDDWYLSESDYMNAWEKALS